MAVAQWTCPRHQTAQTDYCTACMASLDATPDPTGWDADRRAAELQAWIDLRLLTIPFDRLHQRIEQLVGRSVFTHELAHPETLVQEIKSGERASFGDVLAKIPGDKPIIPIVVD